MTVDPKALEAAVQAVKDQIATSLIEAAIRAYVAALPEEARLFNSVPELVNGPIILNNDHRSVTINGKAVTLTKREFEVLRHLMMNRGITVPHITTLREIWGPAHASDEYKQYLRVAIAGIRRAVGAVYDGPELIEVRSGYGYLMPNLSAGSSK